MNCNLSILEQICLLVVVGGITLPGIWHFIHIWKNKKCAGVDCVTLQTGRYSLTVSENEVDAVVTIPMLKLKAGMVTEGKLFLQFHGVDERTVDKIVEYSKEYQWKMHELFDKSK